MTSVSNDSYLVYLLTLYIQDQMVQYFGFFTATWPSLNKAKHQLLEVRIVFMSVCTSVAQLGVTENGYMKLYGNKCYFQSCIVDIDCANR